MQHHLLVSEKRDEQVRRLGGLPAQGLEERRERHRQPERVRGEPLELEPALACLGLGLGLELGFGCGCGCGCGCGFGLGF